MNTLYLHFYSVWPKLRASQAFARYYAVASALSRRVCSIVLSLLCVAGMAYSQAPSADSSAAKSSSFPPPTATAASSNMPVSQPAAIRQADQPGMDLPEAVRDVPYWEGETERLQAQKTKIETGLAGIRRRIAEADQPELRDQVNKADEFVKSINALRPEAGQFLEPDLARTLDWIARNAAERLAALRNDLNDRLRKSTQLIEQLNSQAEESQKDLELNAQLLYVASKQLENARAEHDRQAQIEQLRLLSEKQEEIPRAPAPVDNSPNKKH